MATADLVHLIDLSLGSQPCGVVNFNYLHGLLHEIVRRLVQVEGQGPGVHEGSTTVRVDLKPSSQEGVASDHTDTPTEGDGERKPTESEPQTRVGSPGGALRPQGSQLRPRASIVTAANDLGALERKLQELELRVNTMESLPDLLERKSSDSGATPVHDMWNFTNLSKRLSATEDGLDRVSDANVCVVGVHVSTRIVLQVACWLVRVVA